ncbi:MAG: GWxTD domain-containing protein [Bacteroidales bacterium]|nr:GWxTD domain-containing protein [Bacteroidales bacterium]
MKRFISVAVAIMLVFSAMAQQVAQPKHLTAVFSYSLFYQESVGPYMETYLSFDAWNMKFAPKGNQYGATVEVLMTLSKNDSIELVKKYDLQSPTIASPNDDRFNFLDIQRFAVDNGIHTLSISLRDKNSTDEPSIIEEQVVVLFDKTPRLSSVQMMSSIKPTTQENILSRMGYDMEPYVNDFLPEQIDNIYFYYEIYNIQREVKDKPIYTFSYIEVKETGRALEETKTAERQQSDKLIPVVGNINIAALPSGNYNLVVEVRNRDNQILLYKKVPFFRSNPQASSTDDPTIADASFAGRLNDETQLDEYIEALYPICNESERATVFDIIKKPDIKAKQRFLYHFWAARNPLDPESAWLEYRDRIEYVNANFSWLNIKGYRTDRGRVYLQYGPPDYVRDEKNFVSTRNLGSGVNTPDLVRRAAGNDSDANPMASAANSQGHIYYLPYQLWRYNQLPADDPTRCFIFWDEFRTGHYKLLNSNAKGEVREIGWEQRLSQQQLNENVEGEVSDQFKRGY